MTAVRALVTISIATLWLMLVVPPKCMFGRPTAHGGIHIVETAVQTATVGDYAFPMVSRGRVLGILVLGPKRSGESYAPAPDEREIVQRVAHSVAFTLDVLADDGTSEPAAAKLDAMYDALIRLPHAMREANRELLNEFTRTAFRAGER